MINKNSWEIAQDAELDCWTTNKSKVQSQHYLDAKKKLWERIINSLSKYVTNNDLQTKAVLEFGCGPAGVFLLVENNPSFVCLDPLMNKYMQDFPYIQLSRVRFMDKKLEDFDNNQKFDIILGLNALDHVDNISDALEVIHQLSSEKTFIVLMINIHNYQWLQWILKFAYPILDKLHKYQYTSKQYRQMFEDIGFSVVGEYKVDALLQTFAQSVDQGENHKRRMPSPASIFLALLKSFGVEHYGYEKLNRKSVYSSHCYVLKRSD